MINTKSPTAGISDWIPYSSHISPEIIKLRGGSYLMCFRLQGVNYVGQAQREIDARVLQINQFITQLRAPQRFNLYIQTHCIRSNGTASLPSDFNAGFAADLDKEYLEKVIYGSPIISTDYYISIIYRPYKRIAGFTPFKSTLKEIIKLAKQAEDTLGEIKQKVLSYFADYDIETLGVYENEKGVRFSNTLRFLSYLVNLSDCPVPLQRTQICNYLPTATISFGNNEFVRIDDFGKTRYAAILTFSEYPNETTAGMLQPFLELPWEMTVTQTFVPIDKAEAKSWLDREYKRLQSSDDGSQADIADIEEANEGVKSDNYVLGDFYWSALLIDDSLDKLRRKIAEAQAVLTGCGFKVSPNRMAKMHSYFAQLPGNIALNPRRAKLSSANSAQMMPFLVQNHGKAQGNAWGPAVSMLRTVNDEVFYFNFHAPEQKEDVTGEDVAGNTFITGQTGTGKTVLLSFLLAQSQRYTVKPRIVMFDKDLGASVFIKAMGGQYSQVKLGEPTGWNPFLMAPTEENKAHLKHLIRAILKNYDKPITASEDDLIRKAIEQTLDLPKPIRNIEAFSNFLPSGDESVRQRLHAWTKGEYRWIFNNPTDTFSADAHIIGIDYTQFLDMDEIRTPILMYLIHRIQEMINGVPLIMSFDEAWRPLRDKSFQLYLEDKSRVIRKERGVLVFASQSPADAYEGLSSAFLGQIATHIFLPNPAADEEVYMEKLKLNKEQFELIRSLGKYSREFLVRHQGETAHCKLNMRGIETVKVLSGSAYRAQIADEMIAQYGKDDWLPAYFERLSQPAIKAEEERLRQEKEAEERRKTAAELAEVV
jgi:virB4